MPHQKTACFHNDRNGLQTEQNAGTSRAAAPGIVVVIPARNEEAVIGETLDWLGSLLNPGDRVHVIADRCSDNTARAAWKHGAIVHVRDGHDQHGHASLGTAGKGDLTAAYARLPQPLAVIGGSPRDEVRPYGLIPDTVVGYTFGLHAAPITEFDCHTGKSHGWGGSPSGGIGGGGKGAALCWWLKQTHTPDCGDDVLLILDADTRAAPDLISLLRDEAREGKDVIQARIAPMASDSSPVAMLAALSEVVEHRVKGRLRSRMGWPVRLRGTGMMIRRGILEEFAPLLNTFVEDSELTLLLAERGIHIHYLDQSYAADPKPEDAAGASAQRARWFRGQVELMRRYHIRILRLLSRGPAAWSLLASIFLRPVTLVMGLRMLCTALFAFGFMQSGSVLAGTAAGFGALHLGMDICMYFAGLVYVPDRGKMLGAMLRTPVFVGMWLQSLLLSVAGGKKWHRVDGSEWRKSSRYDQL